MSESFSKFSPFLKIRADKETLLAPSHSALIHKKTFENSPLFIFGERERGECDIMDRCILNLFSLQCLLISCSPDPRVVVLTLHFTLHCTLHRILFLQRKTGSGETFCWQCCCYITINKDWQRNENNRNRFILLSTIHLLQLQ